MLNFSPGAECEGGAVDGIGKCVGWEEEVGCFALAGFADCCDEEMRKCFDRI